MRFMARGLTGLFLAAVTAAILAVAVQVLVSAVAPGGDGGPRGGRPAEERMVTVNVLRIEPGTVVPRMEVFGQVKARRTLDLRVVRGGRIVWLAEGFEEGAAVAEGQLLLRLDPAEATSARDLAAAGLSAAEAALIEAGQALTLAAEDLQVSQSQLSLRRQAFDRQEDLRGRGVGSDAAVETAALALSAAEQAVVSRKAALAQAEASVARAENTLSQQRIALADAERALRETDVRAGLSGRLSGVSAVLGGLVSANESLARIVDSEQLEVAIPLSLAQFNRLVEADGGLRSAAVSVRVDGADAVTGRLVRSSADVSEGQSGRMVFATLDRAGPLRPGDFVSVDVSEPALDGVALLPATAVDAQGSVLALAAGDRLESRPVDVLRRQGDDVIVRVADLAGREVVAQRSPLVGAGILVRPVRPGQGAEQALAPPAEDTVELTDARRAELIAFVEANTRMPADAKARILEQLARDKVPAAVIARLEQRMGG